MNVRFLIQKFTPLLLAASGLICVAAELDRSKPPAPGPAPEIQLGDYTSFELDNGLKVFVVENNKLPTITVSLLVDWDPILEKDKSGYVQMAGEMLRRGTTQRSKEEIDKAVDFIGATLNTSSTGMAGRALKKHGEILFEIMADIAQNANFSPEELEKVRKQTLSNLKSSLDDPNQIASNVRNSVLYGSDHPYGDVTTEASIQNVTAADLSKFHKENFLPNISYLAFIGDIKPDEARSWAEKYLGSWKRGKDVERVYDKPKLPEKRTVVVVDKPGAVQTVLNVANVMDLQPGSKDAIKARVTNILLGGPNFRLFLNLREDKGYTYGAYARFDADKVMGEFRAYAQVRNEVTKGATKEFLYELNRIRDEAVTADELTLAKNFTSGDFARRLEDPATIARYAINIARYNLPKDYYQNYLKEVEAMTAKDVQAIAQKYIHPDRSTIVAVGAADSLLEEMAEYGEIVRYDALGRPIDASAMKVPEGLTADKVVSRYIEAMGGEDAISKLEDVAVNGTMSVMGMSMEFTKLQKAPNMVFSSASMNGQPMFKQVFNGTSGSSSQGGQVMPMDESTIKTLKLESKFVPERFYKEFGVKPELVGAEMLGDKKAYRLAITHPGDVALTVYFDAETGLKLKTMRTVEANGNQAVQTTEYEDYREVNGVMFPYLTRLSAGPQAMEFKTESLEVNSGLSDDRFKVD